MPYFYQKNRYEKILEQIGKLKNCEIITEWNVLSSLNTEHCGCASLLSACIVCRNKQKRSITRVFILLLLWITTTRKRVFQNLGTRGSQGGGWGVKMFTKELNGTWGITVHWWAERDCMWRGAKVTLPLLIHFVFYLFWSSLLSLSELHYVTPIVLLLHR